MRTAAAVLCLLASALQAQEPPLPDTAELEREIKRLVEVFSIAAAEAAEAPALDRLIYSGAIPGMLARLDPHSVFFDRDQFEQLQQMQTSTVKGFGSIVSVLPGRVIVLQVQPGAPAARAGLSPGDEIVLINGIPLAGLDLDQLVQVLGMARQRQVELRIRRPGTAGFLPVMMSPAELQSPSVDRIYLLEPGIGHVRANSFDAGTGTELRAAIEKLGGHQLQGLVLDLRGNPGGVLTAALDTAALLLKPGTRVISARGRGKPVQDIDVHSEAVPFSFRLAVLIDGKSASGSEVVAGAIQDNKRGQVIGERSFGKGLVQSVYPLSGSTGLALTTAYYYTPSGRSIQRKLTGSAIAEQNMSGGITPDTVVRPEPVTPFRAVLEATASFNHFATDWLRLHRSEVRRELEITPAILDEFQIFLSRRNIRPNLREWTAERGFISSRLKQEILNLSLGVDAGDEVEVHRDPVVRRALEFLSVK